MGVSFKPKDFVDDRDREQLNQMLEGYRLNGHIGYEKAMGIVFVKALTVALNRPEVNEPIPYLGGRTLAECFGKEFIIRRVAFNGEWGGRYDNLEGRPDLLRIAVAPTDGDGDFYDFMLQWAHTILHEMAHFLIHHNPVYSSIYAGLPPDNVNDSIAPYDSKSALGEELAILLGCRLNGCASVPCNDHYGAYLSNMRILR